MVKKKPDTKQSGGMQALSPAASTSTGFRPGILLRRGRWFCSSSLVVQAPEDKKGGENGFSLFCWLLRRERLRVFGQISPKISLTDGPRVVILVCRYGKADLEEMEFEAPSAPPPLISHSCILQQKIGVFLSMKNHVAKIRKSVILCSDKRTKS